MIEALLFLVLMIQWPGMRNRVSFMILNTLQLALACQRSMICAQRRLRLTMQHVYGHSGNLG